MKNRITKIGALSLLMSLGACDVDKITSLRDNFQLSISPDAVESKKHIEVINYNYDSNAVPSDIKVELNGQYKDLIYTSAGKKGLEFEENENEIVIGIKQNELIVSPDNPINVFATFSATGFKSRTVLLSFGGADTDLETIELTPNDYIPIGVRSASKEILLKEGKVDNKLDLEVDFGDNIIGEITIPSGIEFLDKDYNRTSIDKIDISINSYSENTDADTPVFDANPEDESIFEKESEESYFTNQLSNDVAPSSKVVSTSVAKIIQEGVDNSYWVRLPAMGFTLNSSGGIDSRKYAFRDTISGLPEPFIVRMPLFKTDWEGQVIGEIPLINPATNQPFLDGDKITLVKSYFVGHDEKGWTQWKKFKEELSVKLINSLPFVQVKVYSMAAFLTPYSLVPNNSNLLCTDAFKFTYNGVPIKADRLRLYAHGFNDTYLGYIKFTDFRRTTIGRAAGKEKNNATHRQELNPLFAYTGSQYEYNIKIITEKYKSIIQDARERLSSDEIGSWEESYYKGLLRSYYSSMRFLYLINRQDNTLSVRLRSIFDGFNRFDLNNEEVCDHVSIPSGVFINGVDQTRTMFFESDLKVSCPSINVTLKNSFITYNKTNNRGSSSIFAKTNSQGKIVGMVPFLEDEEYYVFSVWYDGYKTTPPIKGSEVKSKGINFNVDDICDKIEEVL